MTPNSKIRLLILNDSRAEAERLVSMLQNSGHPTRSQHVENEEGLVKLIQDQTWDLIIGLDRTKNVTPLAAAKHVTRLSKDIPLILLTDEEGSRPIVEGIKYGAADVVRLDEDQHLLQVISRELAHRENRAKQRVAERAYKDIERRNHYLLGNSRDGITFIQDGMILYANQSFADALGHKSAEDIECMPVIDMVSTKDQERLKTFLKEFILTAAEDEVGTLALDLITASNKSKTINIEVRKAQYDEETCIQFVVKSTGSNNQELEARLQQIRHQDLVTGLFNKNHLIEKLEATVDHAVKHNASAALMCIQITDFMTSVQSKVGLASVDIVLGTIAEFAKTLINADEILCRFGEDSFMLLNTTILAGAALARAEEISKALNAHIVDIDGATLQFVYKVGVAAISDTTSDSNALITRTRKALEALDAKPGGNGAQKLAGIFEEAGIQSSDNRSQDETKSMLKKALRETSFRLLFQPILSLRGSDKEHYEVLLRIVDEDGNGISPDEFLSAASEMGVSTKIDRWVILESIKVLAKHRAADNNTRLIINLTRESVTDKTLPPWLGVAFKAAKLPPDAIVFQFSEQIANDHMNIASTFAEQLTALGSECCITNFGCNLNPFNALQHIKANYIKVDGSFTRELQGASGEPAALTDLVNNLHEHEKITIVPFVENASVLSNLWQSGVHYIQGYYLQGPAESMDYDFDTES